FNRIKQYRGLATRYDKHADSFMGGITLAAIRIAIRCNESTA
ncbi:MAG: transposase, partial [Rhodobacteraceae bacterium]|nr:transposase [Paracoccaceae bacterium]MCB1369191.1 transposase [Paracoccaceae bacterium]